MPLVDGRAAQIHWRWIGRVYGVKGNTLKKNALDLLNAAQTVITRGVTLWTSKPRS